MASLQVQVQVSDMPCNCVVLEVLYTRTGQGEGRLIYWYKYTCPVDATMVIVFYVGQSIIPGCTLADLNRLSKKILGRIHRVILALYVLIIG